MTTDARMRARLLATSFVGTLAMGGVTLAMTAPEPAEAVPVAPVVEEVAPPEPPRFADVVHTISKGETLGAILPRYGVTAIQGVVDAASEHTDLTNIRAGRDLVFTYERDVPHAVALRYALDEDTTLVLDLTGDAPASSLDVIEYEVATGTRALDVDGSLWNAAIDAGLRPADIVRLSEVFQWEVDFNTELRAGARFTLVGEELHTEGSFVRLGDLHAVRLENDGDVYTAVQYEQADGTLGWYHPDGTASKRPFLRSPLEYSRVSSKFNLKRYHPVLKSARPHYGTDFAAGSGTPVRATGDGKVVYASTNGGHGKYVKLDHAGPYTTSYSHLSKIAVKNGSQVKQGDLIGYVGSTGLSTGPHLHYEFRVNGKAVDAMNVDLPNVEPLPESEMAGFAQVRDHWLPQLDGGKDSGMAVVDAE
ncbi:MAG: peptidoglycan DD-metalloendopeptidase family protein [Proteobacteria bacterium]|nr:peptidoglycan DD-metalloendopeptidase family protein [Pseudomonadota bacterium]MCP4915464.1 peptidoglycan DD-metalloendopeptidase family protein [Pseudomonadota bacterium]